MWAAETAQTHNHLGAPLLAVNGKNGGQSSQQIQSGKAGACQRHRQFAKPLNFLEKRKVAIVDTPAILRIIRGRYGGYVAQLVRAQHS